MNLLFPVSIRLIQPRRRAIAKLIRVPLDSRRRHLRKKMNINQPSLGWHYDHRAGNKQLPEPNTQMSRGTVGAGPRPLIASPHYGSLRSCDRVCGAPGERKG